MTRPVERSTWIGCVTREPNAVNVYDSDPWVRVTSTVVLRPRSASSGEGITRRVNPAASVSSVSGDGPTNPSPYETRLVHGPPRNSAEMRGLTNVPYTL